MAKEQLQTKPPANTQRIMRVADLPQDRAIASYELRNGDDKPYIVHLCKRQRQVMELLMAGPVYCASPVRLSDVVHILKRDIGLVVDTEFYPGDKATGSGDYGVYFLKTRARKLEQREAA